MEKKRTVENIADWMPFIYILRKEWAKSGQIAEADILVRERIWDGIHESIHKKSIRQPSYLLKVAVMAAASIILCFFAGRAFFKESMEETPRRELLVISAPTSKTCLLPDGTKVWMEAGSELRYSNDFTKNREVWLTGNSTFEVVRQGGNNFKVHLTDSYVEVKGTSFFINQDLPQANIIALYSGRINLVQEKNEEIIALFPSQRIIYNSVEASAEVVPIYENIRWINGHYRLSRIDLADLANFLDWKYNTRIELKKLPRKNLKVTGNIRYDESLESVLNKICYSLNLRYKQADTKYIIHK